MGKYLGKTPQEQLEVRDHLVKIRDTNAFLHENEKKSQHDKLFFKWPTDSRSKTLNTLRIKSLNLPTEGYFQRLSISDVSFLNSLMSTRRGRI